MSSAFEKKKSIQDNRKNNYIRDLTLNLYIMRKFLFCCKIMIIALATQAQMPFLSNVDDVTLTGTYNTTTFLKAAAFDNWSTFVDAYLVTETNPVIRVRRRVGTTVTWHTITLSNLVHNGDIVVGDAGNRIMLVRQGNNPDGINFEIFEWNGTSYAPDTSGNIVQNVSNLTQRMFYGNARLDIDQNDNVILIYYSHNTPTLNSDVNHYFAIAGDIFGNWQPVNNAFNAVVLDAGLGLPANYTPTAGDAGITKYQPGSTNVANFAFGSITATQSFMFHAQIEYADLATFNTPGGSLTQTTVNNTAVGQFIHPSIDAGRYAHVSNPNEDWTLAYTQTGTPANIQLTRGTNETDDLANLFPFQISGGFLNADVAYAADGCAIAFIKNSTDHDNCQIDRDPFLFECSPVGDFTNGFFIRLNDPDRLSGNQDVVAIAGSLTVWPVFGAYHDRVQSTVTLWESTYGCCGGGCKKSVDARFAEVFYKISIFDFTGQNVFQSDQPQTKEECDRVINNFLRTSMKGLYIVSLSNLDYSNDKII
jgi:hypothetical protein